MSPVIHNNESHLLKWGQAVNNLHELSELGTMMFLFCFELLSVFPRKSAHGNMHCKYFF